MNDNWGFSDEDLDGLFRQAAEGQRPRFEPEDWRQMAARLDEAGRDGVLPPVLPWYKRWRWRALAGLLLLTGLTVWLFPASDHPEATRPTRTSTQSAATATNRDAPAESARRSAGSEMARPAGGTAGRTNKADNTPAMRAENPVAAPGVMDAQRRSSPSGEESANAENQPTAGRMAQPGASVSEPVLEKKSVGNGRGRQSPAPAEAGSATASGTGVATSVVPSKKEGVSKSPAPASKRPQLGNQPTREGTVVRLNPRAKPKGQVRDNAPVVDGESTRPQFVTSRTNDGQPAGRRRQENGLESRREPSADLLTAQAAPEAPSDRWPTPNLARLSTRRISFRKINLPVEEPTLSQFSSYYTPPARRAEVMPRGRFGVRVLLAPDLNAVSAMRTFAYGRSVGILAEYEVAPRWRLQTGAIRSQKDYGSTPDDYTPPTPGYWIRWGKPETIDARCAILDVPLNVRFDALRRPRHDLFVSTGLSTFVMLNESYEYVYSSGRRYTHAVSGGSRHLASTLNLSVGYERQLGAGFSLQVEPYLKLPLAGVGWGSVRLYSTGLHLSLGFHRTQRNQ